MILTQELREGVFLSIIPPPLPFPLPPVLGNPIISLSIEETTIILRQATTPSELVLNCSVEAHPIPSLSWSRDDGISARGKQGITGFRCGAELHVCSLVFMASAVPQSNFYAIGRYLHLYEHGTMSSSCCPREVAFSLLSVAVEDLAGRVQFSCTAELMGEAEVGTVSVTTYCECVCGCVM